MSSAPQGTIGSTKNWKTTRDQLVIEEGFNVRFDMGDIEALGQSIADNGIERALKVYRRADGKFGVTDGHRRTAGIDWAISKGKIDSTFPIEIDIATRPTEADRLGQMARANDGKPLLPLEEAALYKRLRETGGTDGGKMTILEVCKVVGRGDVHVRDRLSLLDADQSVIDAVKNGTVRATMAQQIIAASKKDKTKQAAMVAEATAGKDAKKALRDKVDPDAKKKQALRMKVEEIREAHKTANAKLNAAFKESAGKKNGFKSRVDLKEQIGEEIYNLVRLIGAESALRNLVKGAEEGGE